MAHGRAGAITAKATTSTRSPTSVPPWALFGGVAAAYWIGARAAVELSDASDMAAVFFAPAGVTLAALLLVPRSRWWLVLAAAASTELLTGLEAELTVGASLGFALANTAAPLVGALSTKRWAGDPLDLARRRCVGAFVAGAVVLGPATGAALGTATAGWTNGDPIGTTFWEWWLGHALGVLVVAGVVLASRSAPGRRRLWSAEGLGFLALVAGTAAGTVVLVDSPVEFLVSALVVVGAAVFGARGATWAALVAASALAVALIVEGAPAWAGTEATTAWALIRAHLGAAAILGLLLAAESADRQAQAEQAARARAVARSHELFRQAFESLDEACFVGEVICDDAGHPQDYRLVTANRVMTAMTGRSAVEGRTALELDPEQGPLWVERLGPVALDGATVHLEVRSRRSARWLEVSAAPMEPHGRFVTVIKDQTDRHEAEEALRESERRFREMTDELPLVVWAHDAAGRQEWVNRTFCEVFGVSRTEMTEGRWRLLTHPDDGPAYAQAFARAVADRAPFHGRVRLRSGDGPWRWFESWARPRFAPDGTFLGHLGTSADVHDQVEAERRLRSSEEFLRRTLDNLFTRVWVLSLDGTVTEANAAPLPVTGPPPEDYVGRRFWDCAWWSHDPRVQADIRDAVERAAAGETVRYDVPMRVSDEEVAWVEFQIGPLRDDDGVITHLIPSAVDISERRRAEQRLSAALESERLTRRRLELLGTMASDLAAAVTVGDVASAVLSRMREAAGVSLALLETVESEGIAVYRWSPEVPAPVLVDSLVPFTAPLPGAEAIRSGESVVLMGRADLHRRFPGCLDVVRDADLHSVVALPIRSSAGAVRGAFVVGSPDPDWVDSDRLGLLQGVAAQVAQTLERAALHDQVLQARDQEHAIALRLQESLLPDRLAAHPNLEIAARYRAAADDLTVGGDWYDTYTWPSGHVGLVVGDVAGHDLEAAATMGRLRAALAALTTRLDPNPAAVLDALHDCAVAGGADTPFVTAACVILDPADGSAHYACAGHPPPLVIHPDRSTEWLDQALSPPAGLRLCTARTPARTQLGPGATVLLYTDGLIERRDEVITAGLERLAGACAGIGGRPLDHESLDAVIAAMGAGRSAGDDIVLLAGRWHPGGNAAVR